MIQTRNHYQRNSSWNTPYTFSGKEKDVETGYGYFGARYYDSGLSIWLSVDPMSDKYPSMSPYNYCENNPINFIDPTGLSTQDPPYYKLPEVESTTSKPTLREGILYLRSKGFSTPAINGDKVLEERNFWLDFFFGHRVYQGLYRVDHKGEIIGYKYSCGVAPDVALKGVNLLKLGKSASKILKGLMEYKDINMFQAILKRGGHGKLLNNISDRFKNMTVGEVATLAAKGDEEAKTAIKVYIFDSY